MISKPNAGCPCCGSKITVLDVIDVSRHAETVTYYGECDCGATNITVSRGQVIAVTLRPPIEVPAWQGRPAGSQEDPDYMAI